MPERNCQKISSKKERDTQIEIVPLYGVDRIAPSNITVRVNADDKKRVAAVVARAQIVGTVVDAESFTLAKQAAGELKALSNDIQASKRSAKLPFEAVLSAIDELAKSIVKPVADEATRIQGYLNQYVAKLENEAREAERLKREELDRQARVHQQKMDDMKAAMMRAEEAARAAQDEAQREKAKNEAARRQLAVAQAQLERAMELEVAAMTREVPKSLVPDGRVNHPWKFKLVDPVATVKAGLVKLLRIELNVLNCQDNCKAQLEIEPEKDPQLPGIEVSRDISVSVKASSRIE